MTREQATHGACHDASAAGALVAAWLITKSTLFLHCCRVQESTQAHTVRNLLVDQKLERAALLPNEDEALRLMRGPLGRRRVITAAWARDGSKAYNRCASPL